MFDAIAPRYDLVNRLMTFGLDRSWRRTTVGALGLPANSLVLDVACGRVIGVDLSAGMLAANGTGAPLVQADCSQLPFPDSTFDGLVCGYALRNFSDLAGALAETARVLRPGGRVAMLEIDKPASPVLRAGYHVWFEKVVPVLGGALSDRQAYEYLPRSTAYLPAAHELRHLLIGAGYSAVGIRPLAGGLSQLLIATRRGLPVG
jgi:demethylmenaquinone methyltransferase/2-methoxy-6-polyprenyl-1,4-benzoquinol methylase